MGYRVIRGYNWSCPRLMVTEDKEMQSGALEKRYLMSEARDNEDEREADEFISNLKFRAKADGVFIQKPASGRHRGRGEVASDT